MYKVVTKNNHNEVWAVGFYSKEKAENLIKNGYFHHYMYEADKCKELEVIEY